MRKARVSLAFILLFATLLFGITGWNVFLIGKAREELVKKVLRDSSTVKAAKHHVIAILPSLSDPFISNIIYGIQEEGGVSDCALEVFAYAVEQDTEGAFLPTEALRFFEIALRVAPDGLIMYFPAGEKVEPFIEKASQFGVPFVPVAMDVPLHPIQGFVASDSFSQGWEAASIAVSLLGKDAHIGIVLPSGTPNSFTIAEEPFLKGATAALMEKHKGTITSVVREAVSILGSEEACNTMLQSHPDINAILCTSARSTISVAQVIIDRGLVGKIMILGADENGEIIRLLEKGVVQATVVRDAFAMGKVAVRTLKEIWAGNPPNGIIKINLNTKYGRTL